MPRGYLLDVTRLTSRLGRGALTGIDRVEAAYLRHLLGQDAPLFGLLRTRLGYLLLNRQGCAALSDFASPAQPLPAPAAWARPFVKASARGAMALRPMAVARRPAGFVQGLLRQLPAQTLYLNVGHSNLSAPMLSAAKSAGLRVAVMIHDTIPLDYPHFARAGTALPFAAKIAATARWADHVIHISQDARQKTETHFTAAGRVPQGVVAHLGITLAPATPAPFTPQRPYFVALGTIEPRKNIALLLDIWAKLGPTDPQLVILGAKGWDRDTVFAQMAQLSAKGMLLHGENLPDGAVRSLLSGAIALLFPSLAEGFGLPPREAAALGIPVIASDLPVLHETAGDFPVYLGATDSYSWMETITRLAHDTNQGRAQRKTQALPKWDNHFKTVLTKIG